mgnify:CR=1 FL=1
MTFRTDIACAAHRSHWEPAGITVIVNTELGYTTEYRACPELMTPAERRMYEAEMAEMESMEASFPPGYFDGPDESCYFPTIELAIEHAEILDAIHGIDEELRAYHAPRECGTRAFQHLHDRLQAVEAQAINA